MEADLAQPPPPPPATSSAAGLKRVPSRPSSRNAASERGQLDPKLTKWEEWDRYATSMDCDWVVERDMQVFHNALSDEPSNNNSGNDGADQQQPEKIIAASDWAPVKEQRRRRGGGGGSSSKPKKRKDVVREGWAYHISRWPLLGLIFLIILLEFVAYLIVRQSVNTIEFFAGCPSPRSFSLRCGNLCGLTRLRPRNRARRARSITPQAPKRKDVRRGAQVQTSLFGCPRPSFFLAATS